MRVPPSFTASCRNRRGFTLIETVAVLTILSIVAAIVATSLVGRLKRAARDSDASSLATMTDALRVRILRTHVIPAAADLPEAIAAELSLAPDKVRNTLSSIPRAFLVDPALQIGSPTSVIRTLPYQQTVRGSVLPVSPRLMIASSLGGILPVSNAVSSATFTSLWNTAAGTIPTGWSSWQGEPDDLRFSRIDFRTLFHRAVFNNLDPANVAIYSLGPTTNTLALAVGTRFETWFLSGSPLNLHFANGTVQAREFVRADASFIFENGRWSRDVTYGSQPPIGAFGQLVEQFLQAAVPPQVKFGSTPQAVIEEFFTYMYTYGVWATGLPPVFQAFETGGSTSEQQIPQYRVLKDGQARLDGISKNLID